MSLSIPLGNILEKDVDIMEKKLVVELVPKKRSRATAVSWKPPEKILMVHQQDENAMIPFAWGVSYFGPEFRQPRNQCRPLSSTFQGQLRPEQQEIFQETIQYLNRSGSCLMAVYPGGGKCLGRGTPLRMMDGSVMPVEKIRAGDRLQGDNFSSRLVLSTCKGREQMFCIGRQSTSLLDYRVNESHMMTLYDRNKGLIVDISLKEVLQTDPRLERFEGIYMDYDGPSFQLKEERRKLKTIIEKEGWKLPINYVTKVMLCGLFWVVEKEKTHIRIMDTDHVLLHPTYRVVQTYPLSIKKEGVDDYFGFTLDGNGRFLLENGIVTHNTITSLCIASTIRLTTMIFVNKLVLIDQWLETIQTCFGKDARVQVIQGSRCTLQPGCDFYIVNALNVKKHPFSHYKALGIGLLLVDECHLMMTRVFSQALTSITPRYLIGLSATPFRMDGYDLLLELYFGLHRVVRKLHRPHFVYRLDTKIHIEHDRDTKGDILWNSVIDKQTSHRQRNECIANLCRKFPDRFILILSKRIKQIEEIVQLLSTEHVTMMKENENTFDRSARILVATFQKVGTGFSHNQLDMLILASDTEEYFIQYLGRVFRRPDVQPIVIDIVDQHPILKRHFKTRQKIYENAGGIISPYTPKSTI